MISIKNHKAGYLWNQWEHLGPKRRKLLQEFWARLFAVAGYPLVDIQQIRSFAG